MICRSAVFYLWVGHGIWFSLRISKCVQISQRQTQPTTISTHSSLPLPHRCDQTNRKSQSPFPSPRHTYKFTIDNSQLTLNVQLKPPGTSMVHPPPPLKLPLHPPPHPRYPPSPTAATNTNNPPRSLCNAPRIDPRTCPSRFGTGHSEHVVE